MLPLSDLNSLALFMNQTKKGDPSPLTELNDDRAEKGENPKALHTLSNLTATHNQQESHMINQHQPNRALSSGVAWPENQTHQVHLHLTQTPSPFIKLSFFWLFCLFFIIIVVKLLVNANSSQWNPGLSQKHDAVSWQYFWEGKGGGLEAEDTESTDGRLACFLGNRKIRAF